MHDLQNIPTPERDRASEHVLSGVVARTDLGIVMISEEPDSRVRVTRQPSDDVPSAKVHVILRVSFS